MANYQELANLVWTVADDVLRGYWLISHSNYIWECHRMTRL